MEEPTLRYCKHGSTGAPAGTMTAGFHQHSGGEALHGRRRRLTNQQFRERTRGRRVKSVLSFNMVRIILAGEYPCSNCKCVTSVGWDFALDRPWASQQVWNILRIHVCKHMAVWKKISDFSWGKEKKKSWTIVCCKAEVWQHRLYTRNWSNLDFLSECY